jgi:hypothetical protein
MLRHMATRHTPPRAFTEQKTVPSAVQQQQSHARSRGGAKRRPGFARSTRPGAPTREQATEMHRAHGRKFARSDASRATVLGRARVVLG